MITIGPSDTSDPHFELLKCAEEGRIDRLHSLLASRHLPRKQRSDATNNDEDDDEEEEPVILDIECCYRVSGLTPLAAAALEDQVESVEVLLGYGADPNTIDNEGMSPLLISTQLQIAEALLKHGAKVDARDPETGSTAFLLAYMRKDVPLWRLLVQYKANVNVADKTGQHALNSAIDCGDFESASFLLDHGANARLCDSEGIPPLVTACRMARMDLMRLLLANGADIERSEASQADTPLIVAARGNNLEMVRELCNHGCKILKHNKHGDTAIHCARTLGFDDVALVLESFARLRREMMPAGLQPILGPSGSPRFKQEPPLPPSRQKASGLKLAKAVERNHAAIELLGAKMKKIMDEEREQREKEEAAMAAAAEAKRLVIETEKFERIERFRREKAKQEEEEEERIAEIQRAEERARLLAIENIEDGSDESKNALNALMMTALYASRRKAGGGGANTITSSTFETIHEAKRYLEDLRGKALITDDQLCPLPTPTIREWFMPDLLATGPRFVALDAASSPALLSSSSFSSSLSSPLSLYDDGFSVASRAASPSRNIRFIVEPRDHPTVRVRRFVEHETVSSHESTRKLRSLREVEHANLKRSKRLAEKKLSDSLKERLEHVSPRFAPSSSSLQEIGSEEHIKRVFDLGASLVLKGQNSSATITELNVRPGLSFLTTKKREKEGGNRGGSLAAAIQSARNQHTLLTSPMKLRRQ